jgi:CarD family transcriptional regulator
MYETGDYVICRNGGVWKIIGIRADAQAGQAMYSLSAYEARENEMTVQEGGDEIVRKIADKDVIADAIDRIPFIRTIQAPNEKAQCELYKEAMSKYDEIEWIKVIKSVYLRRQQKGFKAQEAEYAARAERYLHSEVSILFDIPIAGVGDFISESVAKNA